MKTAGRADLTFEVRKYLRQHCRGRGFAIKASQLAHIFETNIREVNAAVRNNRRDGHLIGSAKEKPFGYYIPVTDAECRQYLDTFKHELFDMLQTYNRQKRAVRLRDEIKNQQLFKIKPDGQMYLA